MSPLFRTLVITAAVVGLLLTGSWLVDAGPFSEDRDYETITITIPAPEASATKWKQMEIVIPRIDAATIPLKGDIRVGVEHCMSAVEWYEKSDKSGSKVTFQSPLVEARKATVVLSAICLREDAFIPLLVPLVDIDGLEDIAQSGIVQLGARAKPWLQRHASSSPSASRAVTLLKALDEHAASRDSQLMGSTSSTLDALSDATLWLFIVILLALFATLTGSEPGPIVGFLPPPELRGVSTVWLLLGFAVYMHQLAMSLLTSLGSMEPTSIEAASAAIKAHPWPFSPFWETSPSNVLDHLGLGVHVFFWWLGLGLAHRWLWQPKARGRAIGLLATAAYVAVGYKTIVAFHKIGWAVAAESMSIRNIISWCGVALGAFCFVRLVSSARRETA